MPERPGEEVGLVIVRVDDVDTPLTDQPTQYWPDAAVERVPLDHLDIVESEGPGSLIDGICVAGSGYEQTFPNAAKWCWAWPQPPP